MIYNPNFKVVEFDHFRMEAGLNTFVLSVSEWIEKTDAVKNYVLPKTNLSEDMEWIAYAEEADLLNVAMFGCTAKHWSDANPDLAKNNNIRDFASIAELTVLSNLETHNAELIKEGKSKWERYSVLYEIARYQMKVLLEAERIKLLPDRSKREN